MSYKRKKLLLWEDEAKVIEYALAELLNYFRVLGDICKGPQGLATNTAKTAKKDAAEVERILKLVQDAEVTETVVEL